MHRESRETSCSETAQVEAAILVYSGDETSRDLMRRILENAGYRTTVAADGATAQRLLRECAFDLLLIDRWVSGRESEKLIGGLLDDPRGVTPPAVLVVSEDEDSASATDCGRNTLVSVIRPCGVEALVAHVGHQLARRDAAAVLRRTAAARLVLCSTAQPSRTRDQVRVSTAAFTDALEAIEEGFVIWDAEDRLVACNENYRRLFGPNAESVRSGARFADLMRLQLESGILRVPPSPPQDWLARRVAAHRSGQGPWEDEYSDGTWVKVAEARTETGMIVGICTEVSHIRRREIALKTVAATNRRLAAAVNATSSAILITDPNRPGNPTVFANPAFSAMTGWPAEEALGRDRSFLNGGDTDLDAVDRFERALSDGRPTSAELRLQARNGRPIWLDVNASPIRGADGRIANWVIVQTDVTARKTRDEQPLQARTSGTIDPATAAHAHDLDNLLTVARDNLEAAIEAGAGDPEVAGMLGSALEAINRGADVSRSLLGSSAVLPRASAECQPEAAPRRPAPVRGRETILVVDKEPNVRAVIALHLARLGYRILQAGSAEEALNFIDRGRHADLLVTDTSLSGGMDGYRLADAFRARRPDVKVVVVSSSRDQSLPDAAKRLPGVHFLPKPYDRAALAATVRQVLDADNEPERECAVPATPA